jgi:hypothetical protein
MMALNYFGRSNWENMAFYLIEKNLNGSEIVYRRDIFSNDDLYYFSDEFGPLLGHKKKPIHPEETLQRTIQNLRDKGFLNFLGQGEYQLTTQGRSQLKNDKYIKFRLLFDILKTKSAQDSKI